MFLNHVTKQLPAYCRGELSADETRSIAEHVFKCRPCRKVYEEIKFGISLGERLGGHSLPDSERMWKAIEAGLAPSPELRRPGFEDQRARWLGGFRGLATVSVGILALIVMGSVWFYSLHHSPQIKLSVVATPLSIFETTARNLHQQNLDGRLQFDFVTNDPRELRKWVSHTSNVSAWVAIDRPSEDTGRYVIHGAQRLTVEGIEAVCVSFSVDSHVVTLLTANQRDILQTPKAGLFSKDIVSHFDAANGLKLLTWAKDGQAYVMVSDLPEFGQQGCFVCHTAPDRRNLIRKMHPQ